MTVSHSFSSWPPGMHPPGTEQVWFVANGSHQTDPGEALNHVCKLLNSQLQQPLAVPRLHSVHPGQGMWGIGLTTSS